MASITDIVKEGLKYPFYDGKKVLMLGAFFFASAIISYLISLKVYDSILILDNYTPLGSAQLAFSAIPPANTALIVLGLVATFVLMLFVSGYLYEVIRYSIEKRHDLPEFNDVKGIFIKGLRTLAVSIGYGIVPFLLFFWGLMLMVNESVGESVNMIGLVILFISIIVAIFLYLVQIIALAHMVANDDLKAAFRFREIFDLISRIGWLRFIGVALFTFIVLAVISIFIEYIVGIIATAISVIFGSALVMFLVTTIFDSFLLNPYISVFISRIYGSLYNEALE